MSYLSSPAFPWKSVVIGLSVGKFMLESYLSLRQYRILNKSSPPAVLAKEISKQTFDKSQAYGRAKARCSFGGDLWYTAINTAFLQSSVYAKLWDWSGNALLK